MITAVFGVPGSGKSVYAENELGNVRGSVLYVGTLPRSPFFADKLRAHSARRPSTWDVFELTESWAEQGASFCKALLRSDFGLIEGLAYYVYRQSSLSQFGGREESELLTCLQELHAHAGRFFVVDPPIPTTLATEHKRRLCLLQDRIVSLADAIVWVECGHGVTINGDEVRRLLGIGVERRVS